MKRIGWVLRPKTKHAGRIPSDAWEKSREVTQVAGGMSRAAQSSMDSDHQSIWLAGKQDVFNPGCCWLQCSWFHQICIILCNQDRLCNVKAENPSLDLRHIYKWNYMFKKKKEKHSAVVLICAVFQLSEHNSSCIPRLRCQALVGAVESWPPGVLGGFSVSLRLPLAVISLKKIEENVHWSWPVVSLHLAGDGKGVDMRAAAARLQEI